MIYFITWLTILCYDIVQNILQNYKDTEAETHWVQNILQNYKDTEAETQTKNTKN